MADEKFNTEFFSSIKKSPFSCCYFKYFLTPKALVKKEEVYEGWGLLEYDGKRVRKLKLPEKYECDNKKVLISMAHSGYYLYHQQVSKIMSGFDWKSYKELEDDLNHKDKENND